MNCTSKDSSRLPLYCSEATKAPFNITLKKHFSESLPQASLQQACTDLDHLWLERRTQWIENILRWQTKAQRTPTLGYKGTASPHKVEWQCAADHGDAQGSQAWREPRGPLVHLTNLSHPWSTPETVTRQPLATAGFVYESCHQSQVKLPKEPSFTTPDGTQILWGVTNNKHDWETHIQLVTKSKKRQSSDSIKS